MEKKLEKKSTENNKKLSYEELNNAAQLNFKFKIVEMSDKFPKDFVDKITAEIMEDMDMSEPTKEESNGK